MSEALPGMPQGTQDSGSSGQRLLRLHPLKIPRDTAGWLPERTCEKFRSLK